METSPSGWLTCNLDATFFEKDYKCSFRCILRYETRGFLAGCGGRLTGALDPRVVEFMAFREALSWIKKIGNQKVCIELDSLSVVKAIHSKTHDDFFFGSVI